MQFNPLTPRLQSIPKDDLLTEKTIATLSDIVSELDTMSGAMKRAGAQRHTEVSRLANNVLSVANAIEDGEGNIEMMRNLRTRLETHDASLLDLETEYANAKSGSQHGRYNDEIATFKNVLAGYTVDDPKSSGDEETAASSVSVDVETVLKNLATRNRAIQRRLPRSSKVEKYTIIKLPVLVIVENNLKPAALQRIGFDVSDMEGYPVIEDQMILAIRTEYSRSWDQTPGETAEEIVETISRGGAGQQPIRLVSEEGRSVKGSNGFMYYWIMPERYYNKLMPVMGAFEDWSIAS